MNNVAVAVNDSKQVLDLRTTSLFLTDTEVLYLPQTRKVPRDVRGPPRWITEGSGGVAEV